MKPTAMTKTKHSASSGFTMIEVLLAIVILGIGVLATSSMVTSSLTETRNASEKNVALKVASEIADRLMPLQYDVSGTAPELTVGTHVPTDGTAIPASYNQILPGANRVQWTVTAWDADGDATNDSLSIMITVAWDPALSVGIDGVASRRNIVLHCSRAIAEGL